jgi:hypothetical protein
MRRFTALLRVVAYAMNRDRCELLLARWTDRYWV